MKKVSITTEGIQKNLKKFKPMDALCEYIWNGFDAEATTIRIDLKANLLGLIDMISIKDNGTGIVYEELNDRFSLFNDSEKFHSINNMPKHSIPHGKQGIGRLTFFAFAQEAIWNTVYKNKEDRQSYEYYIVIKKDSLNQFDDNNGEKPKLVEKETGTEVIFTGIQEFSKDEIIECIKINFSWFLELNKYKNYKIYIDGVELSYEDYIVERRGFTPNHDLELKYNYEISFVQWNKSLGKECSRFYFLDSLGTEKFKETTKFNRKSDEFYHSVFIKSEYFNNFFFDSVDEEQISFFNNRSEEEYKRLIGSIYKFLTKFRKEYLKDSSDKFIDKMISSHIYPEFGTDDILGDYRKNQLNALISTLYIAQPKIFTSLTDDNKKITINLLNMIMDSECKDSLFAVLKQVVALDKNELDELANVLKFTSLSNVTKLVKLIEDRQRVIQNLKELVFDKELFAKEVPHIQSVVESHYWIFGEQYNLITAAEPDFTSALKRLLKVKNGKEENIYIDHEDKNKEMDIFMIRQDRKGKVTENVVVELKRPIVALGEKEVSQVKNYLRVIRSDDRFNMGNAKWIFYLVGNKFNTSGFIENELENNKSHGEDNLIYSIDRGMTKIYVLKWSEIFDEFSRRYEFLLDKLKLEEELWIKKHNSADEAVEELQSNSAVMPKPLIPKRAK